VQRPDQKANVLAAANGIDGVNQVVDEIEVRQAAAAEPTADAVAVAQPSAPVAEMTPAAEPFSFKKALVAAGPNLQKPRSSGAMVAPAGQLPADQQAGAVQMAAATEAGSDADAKITAAVVSTLGAAQRQGRLK